MVLWTPNNHPLGSFLFFSKRSFIHSFIMADTDQQLEDVRMKIQAAEAGLATALALGAEAYTAALAHLTSLQNKELFLMQLKQNPGEQR